MASLDFFSLLVKLCSLVALYAVVFIIYNVHFHPLARFPGPFLAKICDFYTWKSIVKKDRMLMHTRMLEKYGSPMRIGPNELIFSDIKAFAEIHGQSSQPCLKDPKMYSLLTATGAVSLISATERTQHARLRRILTPGFSIKEILKSEPLIAEKIETFMELVFNRNANGQPLDIYHKIHEHHLDLVSQLSFGKSFNTLSGEKRASYRDVDLFLDVVPAIAFFPAIKYLPIQTVKDGQEGLTRLQTLSRNAILECMESLDKEDDDNVQGSFLKRLITAKDPETGTKMTMEELVENTIIFLVAGTDTSAATTTYTIWECARNPEVKEKLVEEIRTAFPNPKIMPTYQQACKLPYLSAVIEETLRLHGPSNIGVPRLSPGRIIGDHYIPKGTVVSTIPYAMVRNPGIFPDPESYKPERWFDPTLNMREASRPFGYGPRGCIAKSFAEVGITLTIARLFQLFDVEVDSCMTEDMMRTKDRGVLQPFETKLVVRATKADFGEKGDQSDVQTDTVEINTFSKVEALPNGTEIFSVALSS